MTADGWAKTVRQQIGLGRVLPLGGPRDGAWITERAAGSVLRRAAGSTRGLRLGTLRISIIDPDAPYDPAVPPPPSALPPGPLRVGADFLASADPTAPAAEPLPATAARLRAALAAAATERLGLTVTEVDLRVTGLLDADEDAAIRAADAGEAAGEPVPEPPGDGEESRVAAAALSVPGVTRLTGALGGLGRAVHIETGPALPRRHVRVEVAVTSTERALDVARAVRTAVGEALPDHPSVAVVVTAVD
ncbi:nucleopolyhedrovirus P10 family protein [Streptomyces sp. KM273126]|uniref:nucleopolyhedrovirus P10 family protein n=1 Tax=Streptomyces sp. KM273126 TaxID=2545247 RepID=UPI00103C694C|nr:nucleopolyhedrovirus P10 family protein [Streptomyces sp. KM273126]MBA2812216.1 nucleopolyhedrovirus P10 family protein [Streptomyces sp. KM273126]